MKNNDNIRTGLLPYICIAVLACLLRLTGLGGASLSVNEVENAMTAVDLFASNGEGASQLLYELPTALLFKAFGVNEFTARLFPAVCGIILALLPLFFMNRLGRGKALVLGFLFAVDPVLLFWSKRADALLPSVLMTAAAAVCLYLGMNARGIFFLFLAFCGGERAFPALIILIVLTAGKSLINMPFKGLRLRKRDVGAVCLAFLALILCFGAFPGGIACFGNGFVNSFSALPAWTHPGAAAILAAVLLYFGIQILLLIFRCALEHTPKYLLQTLLFAVPAVLWMGVTALPYVSVLLWLIDADLVLGMHEAVRRAVKGFAFWVTACAVPALYSYFLFRMVDLFRYPTTEAASIHWNGETVTLPFSRMTASVILTVISVIIIALVVKILSDLFDSRVFFPGLICGGMIIVLWGMAANAWTAGNFDREWEHPASARASGNITLLDGGDATAADSTFLAVFEETRAKRGNATNRPWVLNLASDDALLRWQLRNVDDVADSGNAHAYLSTVDVILDSGDSGSAPMYIGFSEGTFEFEEYRNFRSYSLYDWGNWFLFQDGPKVTKTISMWIRNQYLISHETGEIDNEEALISEAQ